MKTMCSDCGIEMKTCFIGVYVVEMAGDRPYKTWSADEQECEICGRKVIAQWGVARYHHDKGFDVALLKMLEAHPEKIRICWEKINQVKSIERGIGYLKGLFIK